MGKNHYIGGSTEIYINDRLKSLKKKIYKEFKNDLASSYLSYSMVDRYFDGYEKEDLESVLEDVKVDFKGRKKVWLTRIKGEKEILKSNKSKKEDKNRNKGNIGTYFKGSLLKNNAIGKIISFGDVSGKVIDINNQNGILSLECSRSKTKKKFSINFIYNKYVK